MRGSPASRRLATSATDWKVLIASKCFPTLGPVHGSSEVLASRRSQDMLMELKSANRGGVVIVDLPPVLLADDVLTVAPALDGVVLVTAEGITRREDVLRTRDLLRSVRVLGTVLNRASESETRAY